MMAIVVVFLLPSAALAGTDTHSTADATVTIGAEQLIMTNKASLPTMLS